MTERKKSTGRFAACVKNKGHEASLERNKMGAEVTVIADGDGVAFEATAEEESELLEAIAGVERGETLGAEELFARLGR